MMANIYRVCLLFAMVMLYSGCEKFLHEMPDDALKVPSKFSDLQAILDDTKYLRQRHPKAAEMSSDDYYLADNNWGRLDEYDRRMYVWEKDKLFSPGSSNDWANAYYSVNKANIVLTYLDVIKRTAGDQDEWNDVKGQALFLRAQTFLQIAVIWTGAYSEHTAGTDLGIPLWLSPDSDAKVKRSSLKQTYDRMISDLKYAVELLPVSARQILRPSKAAAYALLARVYLAMGKYTDMGIFASLSLELKSTLKDYNTLNIVSPFPFAPDYSNLDEVIVSSNMVATPALHNTMAKIDSTLYTSFQENDLRKKIFFNSNGGFKGSYAGSVSLFNGLATDEVYLMRAESYARAGNTSAAMKDLNKLLEKRFLTNTFVPVATKNPAEALSVILTERRKELIMRGLRWMDVKRLNKEGAGIVMKRVIDRQTYLLPPNDPRYALPIPENVIRETGIVQNPR